MTKTEIAKTVVNLVVANRIGSKTVDVVSDQTNLDREGLPAQAAEVAVGIVVAPKIEPYTDKLVDAVVAKFIDFKMSRAAK